MSRLVSRLAAEGSVDVRVHLVGSIEHGADILVPGDTLVIASPGEHKVTLTDQYSFNLLNFKDIFFRSEELSPLEIFGPNINHIYEF